MKDIHSILIRKFLVKIERRLPKLITPETDGDVFNQTWVKIDGIIIASNISTLHSTFDFFVYEYPIS